MLRSNLSTQPFYNERAVHLLMGLAAVLVLGFTAFNVSRIVSRSNQNTALVARAAEAEAHAEQLRAAAQRTRRTLDPKQIAAVSASSREANAVIDRRLFSWTELFNYLETTLPDDVRITSVRTKAGATGAVMLAIAVVSRRVEEVDRFINALEGTQAFKDVLSVDERTTDEGDLQALLEARYSPIPGAPRAIQPQTPAEQGP